jgi:hypothetical protein
MMIMATCLSSARRESSVVVVLGVNHPLWLCSVPISLFVAATSTVSRQWFRGVLVSSH